MSKEKRANLGQSVVLQMRQFIANSILFNQRLADQLGINATDYQMLNLIDLRGAPTPGEIAQLTGFTTGGVTVALDRLERAKFVRRERNPRDRRSVIVRIVAERMVSVFKLYEPIHEHMRQVFAAYSEKELRLILDFFLRCNGPASQSMQQNNRPKQTRRDESKI